MPRLGRLDLDESSQPDNEVIDRTGIGVFPKIPDLFEHDRSRHCLTFMFNKEAKKIRFHQRQLHRLIGDPQLKIIEVDGATRELEYVSRGDSRTLLLSAEPSCFGVRGP